MKRTQTNENSLRQWTINVLKYSKARKWFALNPKWPPKWGLSTLVQEIKDAWYEYVSRETVVKASTFMIGMDEPTITLIANDLQKPIAIRIIAKALLEWVKKGGLPWIGQWMLDNIVNGMYAEKKSEEPVAQKIENLTINVLTINDRQQTPWYTGLTSIPEKLPE